jgi:type IV secretory pathway VirB4 component
MNLHNSMLNKDDFNEKNLGNTSVIGTAGSGKTMLMAFIQVMMQKYRQPGVFRRRLKRSVLLPFILIRTGGRTQRKGVGRPVL